METSSPSRERDEDELELESVVSDLHALKKLYGLLHKVPHGNYNTNCGQNALQLDEKSKSMLKKLLDGATQHALQCQAKIVSCVAEPPCQSERPPEGMGKCIGIPDESRKCHLCLHRESSELHIPQAPSTTDKEDILLGAAEQQVQQKQNPGLEMVDPERQKPEKAGIIITVGKLDDKTKEDSSNHHRRMHHDPDCVNGPLGTKSTKRLMSVEDLKNRDKQPTIPTHHTRVPSQKASRVDAPKQSSRVSSRTQPKLLQPTKEKSRTSTSGAIEPRFTRTRSVLSLDRLHSISSSRHTPARLNNGVCEPQTFRPRTTGLGDERTKRTTLPHRTADNVQKKDKGPHHQEQKLLMAPKRKDAGCSSGRRSEKPRSHGGDLSLSVTSGHFVRNQELGQQAARKLKKCRPIINRLSPCPRKHPTRISNQIRSIQQSSPSHSTGSDTTSSRQARSSTTRSESSNGALIRPSAGATRRQHGMLSHRSTVGSKIGQQQKKKEGGGGGLRRFKNRLAVIFHHHHHHHHHLHDSDGKGGARQKRARASPWEYIRRIILHTSTRTEQGDVLSGKRAVAKHEHQHLHRLVGGLLRHVWGTKERRAAKARRRRLERTAGTKRRMHWWQIFGKGGRGGLKLGNRRKKPLLRLGSAKRQGTAKKL